jgi:hypothetical protein
MVLKVGYFGKQITNSWNILKYGAGEGQKRSFGQKNLTLSQAGMVLHKIKKKG